VGGPAGPAGALGPRTARRTPRASSANDPVTEHGTAAMAGSGAPTYGAAAADPRAIQAAAALHAPVPELLLDKPGGGGRVVVDPWAVAQCVLLPWGLFVGIFYLTSFAARYQHKELVWTLLFFGLTVPLVIGARAFSQWRRPSHRSGFSSPSWYPFLAATCLLAWIAGLLLGDANFSSMTSYYEYSGLSFPSKVDPRDIPGSHYLDAGGIYFAEGASVNQTLSLGFKDGTTYCVAPITIGGDAMASYDFWAVGTDCCVPMPPARFWCGSSSKKTGSVAGMRFTGSDETKNMYKLAIQQAMAEYHIMARSPLLFEITADPVKELEAVKSSTRQSFFVWIGVYLAFQTALVLGAVVFHGRKGRSA